MSSDLELEAWREVVIESVAQEIWTSGRRFSVPGGRVSY